MRKRGNQWPKNKIINIKKEKPHFTHNFHRFLQTNKSLRKKKLVFLWK